MQPNLRDLALTEPSLKPRPPSNPLPYRDLILYRSPAERVEMCCSHETMMIADGLWTVWTA